MRTGYVIAHICAKRAGGTKAGSVRAVLEEEVPVGDLAAQDRFARAPVDPEVVRASLRSGGVPPNEIAVARKGKTQSRTRGPRGQQATRGRARRASGATLREVSNSWGPVPLLVVSSSWPNRSARGSMPSEVRWRARSHRPSTEVVARPVGPAPVRFTARTKHAGLGLELQGLKGLAVGRRVGGDRQLDDHLV